jgi:hypothetical protein
MVSYDLQFDFLESLLGLGPKNRNYSSNLRMDFKVFWRKKISSQQSDLGQFIASFISIVKLGIHRSICGQLRLGIPGDGTA